MMSDLPPDVRDRAAAELCRLYLAKMLTLPAGLPGIQFHEITEDGRDMYRELVDAVAEVLAVPFQEAVRRNALNAATVVDVMAEQAALKARVDLLTSALTELVALDDNLLLIYWHDDPAWANARAVLSATPTEEAL